MRRARWVALGLALAVAGGALAVQTVGVPAILRITSLGLGMAAQQPGNGTALQASATYNGAADVALLQNQSAGTLAATRMRMTDGSNSLVLAMNNTNNSNGLQAALLTGNASMPVCIESSSTGFCVQQSPAQFTIQGTPTMPWPLFGDGTSVTSRTLAGRFNGTAGGCTITNSSGGFGGCSGSTGLYTITFSHSFSAAPACTASNENGTAGTQASVAPGVATSQVAVSLTTQAGANTTGNFDVICVGK